MPEESPQQHRRPHRVLMMGGLAGLALVALGLVAVGRLDVDLGPAMAPRARLVVEQFWGALDSQGLHEETAAVQWRTVQGAQAGEARVAAAEGGPRRAAVRSGLVWVNARAWDGPGRPAGGKVVVAALAWQARGMESWALRIQGRCGTVTSLKARRFGEHPALAIYETALGCRPQRFELFASTARSGLAQDVLLASLDARPRRRGGLRPQKGIWPVTEQWSRVFEWFYSAWIRQLFSEPRHTWRPLHQVIRNPRRNLLYGLLGLDEDDEARGAGAVTLWADCADVPYQLRSYFAWKLGLAMRFRECSRGSATWGPRCDRTWTNLVSDFDSVADPVARFNRFVREGVAWKVHSGTLRTLPEDSDSDAYPVAVRPGSVAPGAMYVDVAGHVLVVVAVGPSDLVAVDGHPDKTVTVRRFSRPKYFPFYRTLTGGLKAFRPLRYEQGRVRALSNRDLGAGFSLEQYSFDSASAYYRFVRSRLFAGLSLRGSGARASADVSSGLAAFHRFL